MLNKTEIVDLAECRRQIETRLGWGDSMLWTSGDFEQLSEKIRDATQIYLSASTLKRIWGRIKYDSLPAVTTLNTLAQFAGYDNWRAFRQNIASTLPAEPPPSAYSTERSSSASSAASDAPLTRIHPLEGVLVPPPPPRNRRFIVAGIVMAVAMVIVILGFYFAGRKSPTPPVDPSRYRFSSKKVLTEGVPNSVIFDYDATASPVDSVYIQQSWDPTRRKKVSRDQRQFTSVYYYPGFFQAKLVVGNQIVKEHNLLIKTKGWLPVIEQIPLPVYFEEKEALSGNELGLSVEKIREKNISLQPRTPWVRYSNIGNWGDLQTDSFRLDLNLKNDYREGSAICQQTEIRLLCDGAAIIIPLCDKGCISELNILLLEKSISGKVQDLSFLGVDFHNWVHFACTAAGGQFRIFIDNALVFQSPLPEKSHKIEGIDFRFQGTGRIRDVSLRPR